MKTQKLKIGLLLLAIAASVFPSATTKEKGLRFEDKPYIQSKVMPFSTGEKLTYRVHYGWLNAGIAEVEVLPAAEFIDGRRTLHVKGTGKTVSAFEWFYKVRDVYESNIEVESMSPLRFKRRVNEGGFTINRDYDFQPENKKVFSHERKKTYNTLENPQDMLSSFYFLRTIDFSKAKPGDVFTVNTFMDHENFPFKVRLMGEETIEVDAGEFECYKFSPVVEEGRVFKSEDDLKVWVTKDHNKIPIMVEAEIIVGSVKMELNKYKNIANPLALR
jgi:hypothetical protein